MTMFVALCQALCEPASSPRNNSREKQKPRSIFTSRRHTLKTAGVLNTAGAAVLGDLRVRTERSRAIHSSFGAVRREHGSRRLSPLDPRFERANGVECI